MDRSTINDGEVLCAINGRSTQDIFWLLWYGLFLHLGNWGVFVGVEGFLGGSLACAPAGKNRNNF